MYEVHKAKERGKANHGWLKTNYSFSFADYYNPQRMGFGALRVLNDDVIAPSAGFDTHPHKDMEIITIVTKGELLHEDDTGSKAAIGPNDVQVMSAGSGILHSEHNHSREKDLELFQLWITPDKKRVKPRHEEMSYKLEKNKPVVIAGEGGIPIHQDARVQLAEIDETYLHKPKEGTYIMVVEGEAEILGQRLSRRDAIAITDEKEVHINPKEEAKLLIIDVPMND